MAHEVGHFLDFEAEGSGRFATDSPSRRLDLLLGAAEKTRTYRRIVEAHGQATEALGHAWKALREARRMLRKAKTPHFRAVAQDSVDRAEQRWRERKDDARLWSAMLDRRELFARAYSQWVAWRSGDDTLMSGIDSWLRSPGARDQLMQWPYNDFLPLIWQFDTLFEGRGWVSRTRITT